MIVGFMCSFSPVFDPRKSKGKTATTQMYSIFFRERQKMKYFYGNMTQKAFEGYIRQAKKAPTNRPTVLMRELEMRVATILFRVGFVKTFRQAHYLIKERCIYVNGERVNLPRQRLHVGDVLHVRTKHKANGCNLPRGEFHITEPLPYRTHRSYSLPNQTPSGFSSPFPSCHGHF